MEGVKRKRREPASPQEQSREGSKKSSKPKTVRRHKEEGVRNGSEKTGRRPPKPLPRYHSIQEPDTAPAQSLTASSADHAPAIARRPTSRDAARHDRPRKSKLKQGDADASNRHSHRSHTPRDHSDVTRRHSSASSGGSQAKAKSGRNKFVQENRERSRPTSASLEAEGARAQSPSDDASSVHSSESRKKLMLKYMLHEVREIKRSIDPNLPDFHVTPKRTRRHKSDDDVTTSLNDSQNLEGFEEYFVTGSSEGFETGVGLEFTEAERKDMLRQLKTYFF